MEINTQISGSIARLALSGKFTSTDCRNFSTETTRQMTGTATTIEVDFGQVTYMDSSALGALLMLKEKAKTQGKNIILCNCKGDIKRVLEIANFHKLFTLR